MNQKIRLASEGAPSSSDEGVSGAQEKSRDWSWEVRLKLDLSEGTRVEPLPKRQRSET